MNDLKNLTLAWISSVSSVFAAIEAKTLITVTSAIILPIIFFALGKTVDVILQIYLSENAKRRETKKPEPGAAATGLLKVRTDAHEK